MQSIEVKQYVVEFSANLTAGFYFDRHTDDLEEARKYCALQVITNPNVAHGLVIDTTKGGMLVYYARDPETARQDLMIWGDGDLPE